MGTHEEEFSTLDLRRFDPTRPPAISYRMAVLSGSDPALEITIDGSSPGRLYVGVGEGCDLRLTDRAVSRRHLAAELEDDSLRIQDLDSTNGTFIGGIRIRDALLAGGESVRVGSTTLQIERRTAAASPISSAVAFGRVRGASREMRRLYPLCRGS